MAPPTTPRNPSKLLLGLLFLIIMTHGVAAASDLIFYRDARREGNDVWLSSQKRGSTGCVYVDRRSLKKSTNVSLTVGFKRQDNNLPPLLGRRLSVELKPASKFSQSMTPVSFVISDIDAILSTDRKKLDVSLPRDFWDSWTHKIYLEFCALSNRVDVWLDRKKDPVLSYDELSLVKVFGGSFSVGVCSTNLDGGPVVQLQVFKIRLVNPASPPPPPPPPPPPVRIRRLFSPPPPPSPQKKQPIEPPPNVVSPPLPSPPEEPRSQLSPAEAPKTGTARKRKFIIMLVLGILVMVLAVTVYFLYAKGCCSGLRDWLFDKYPSSPSPVVDIDDVFPRGFQPATLTRRRGRGCRFF